MKIEQTGPGKYALNLTPPQSNVDDVRAFHERFRVPIGQVPQALAPDVSEFRRRFLAEELTEYERAVEAGDLAGQFDALIDLVYVALGTAIQQGFPWQAGWDEVQKANMAKARASDLGVEGRHGNDVAKPEGWTPPDIEEVLRRATFHSRLNATLRSLPDEPPRCATCHSKGFEKSVLANQCTFCDGTDSGNPPEKL